MIARTVKAAVCRLLLPRPTCRHGIQLRARAWNVYWPCKKGCGTVEPERLYHRWGYRLTRGHYDPFGRDAGGKVF